MRTVMHTHRRSVNKELRVLQRDWNLSNLPFSHSSEALSVVLYTMQEQSVFAVSLVTVIASINHYASDVFTKFSIVVTRKATAFEMARLRIMVTYDGYNDGFRI
jgi:hypothetical protein